MAEKTRQVILSGRSVIDMTLGEPDFPTPKHICDAAVTAIANQETKYTPINGTIALREAISRKFKRDNGLEFGLGEISVACGGKQVLYQAFLATLRPGDEVVMPTPYWASYADMVTLHAGVLKPITTRVEDGFLLQPEALEAALTERTKWVVLNSPSNPSGAAYTGAQLKALTDVIENSPHRNFWILADDIYEHILFDGMTFATVAQVAPKLRERTLTANGVSKAYSMTGWRVGFAGGPKPLIDAMTKLQMQVNSHTSSISQAAAAAALDGPHDFVRDRCAHFQARRDLLLTRFAENPSLVCPRPQGAFYLFPSVAALLGRQTPEGETLVDDVAFSNYLLTQGVAVVPGSGFGMSGHVRLSYATSEVKLEQAADRIKVAVELLL
ncbi:MAG: pyridoxal phosphate-dependent aminotransferase [Rubrivivax sp.]|nr:pyridoxal phosphate-dependent aminotransferase [Rubrivivax sp.]MBK7260469.1 pyridoxal phosphate-dependent aminotransferase [Rubrivivax sp.]MBK8526145.1 pyridoxal phosphate-dependent aminotransferase [Rubrivivax sp.]